MMGRRSLRVVLLGAFLACVPPILSAQLPPRLKKCLPYPTLADEACNMTGQGCDREGAQNSEPKIVISAVKFTGGNSLPANVRTRVFATVKPGDEFPGPFREDWLSHLGEVRIREALQRTGYFRAEVETKGQIIDSNTSSQRVAITVRIDEGHRYTLGSIRFRSAIDSQTLIFSQSELRQLIHLHKGWILDADKIRQGLESLSRLYEAQGYIDFTSVPDFEVEEDKGVISVIFILDLEKQYRIAKVEVWGPTPVAEKTLQAQWKTGEIFKPGQLNAFFKDNAAFLPADASGDDLKIERHSREGTVDLRFDFRACPSNQE